MTRLAVVTAWMAALAVSCSLARAAGDEARVNVAAAKWGLAKADASSEFGPGYSANNVFDGRWASRETDKWNTASNVLPHWLRIDLGRAQTIDRVVIRHEGALADGARYNTSDFRLQKADVPDGPWTDLVEPIRGNKANVTTHDFAPVKTRYLRLLIEKGEQNANEFARIFEVEVYAPLASLEMPLVCLDYASPPQFRKSGAALDQLVTMEVQPADAAKKLNLRLEVSGFSPVALKDLAAGGRGEFWAPIRQDSPAEAALVAQTPEGKTVLARKVFLPPAGLYLSGGTINLVSSSHQDYAWMDEPQNCIKYRDEHCITPALAMMRKDKDYCFVMENMINLVEYLERHPDRRAEIYQRMKEGRMEWGATYNQPYEAILSGEQLVRETYYGRRWLTKNFPDCDAKVAFTPDVPARSLQMQQILFKAGIPYLVTSRYHEGIYHWLSPDGTGVIAWTPGHYCNQSPLLNQPAPGAVRAISTYLHHVATYYQKRRLPPAVCLLNSVDFSQPTDFRPLIELWNKQGGQVGYKAGGAAPGAAAAPTAAAAPDKAAAAPAGAAAATAELMPAPRMQYSSARGFFDRIAKGIDKLDTLMGERPNCWLYIAGPTHHWAISAKREAGVVLPAAETFSTIDCLLAGNFKGYPSELMEKAWRASILDDHGWGGKGGEITDALFLKNHEFARDNGKKMLAKALDDIAGRVKTQSGKGTPVVVFNALTWPRSDVVTCTVPVGGPLHVVDAAGKTVGHQVLPAEEKQAAGSTRLGLLAADVPGIGYKTFYVSAGDAPASAAAGPAPATPARVENDFYRIDLAPGGIKGIHDKQLDRDLLQTGKFLGGEVFTMQSVGTGAGEFGRTQQPTMEGFDKVSTHQPAWQIVAGESGPLWTVCALEQKFSHCTIRQRLVIYNPIKRIDFEISILGFDGTKYREFRSAFPLNLAKASMAYEVPMGVCEIGTSEIPTTGGLAYGSLNYDEPCRQMRPREMQNFFSASDDRVGVTISTSVGVCDFKDPTTDPLTCPVFQPILMASRRSCHGEGNWYLQAGDHSYRFSLYSHTAGWRNGYKLGIASNNPLRAVVAASAAADAALPEEKSFCTVSPANVIVSTLKKCEDDDTAVLRCYEIEGRDSQVDIGLFVPPASVQHTNLIEEEGVAMPVEGGKIRLAVGHNAIETLKVAPAAAK